MKIYKSNIERDTIKNTLYRKVLNTTPQLQLVLMTIPAGENIGAETHKTTTQFIRVEKGTGVATVGGMRKRLKDGDAIIIPPNVRHDIKATSDLHLYTIYSPPEHPKTCRQVDKFSKKC